MKKVMAMLAAVVMSSCSMAAPIDTIKTLDFEISYWDGWKAINYKEPKDGIDIIIYPDAQKNPQANKNISIRISHEYNEKIKWGHIRESTIDYPSTATEKYNYKLISNEYVKKENAKKEEVLVIVFEGSADGVMYTIVQNIYAIDLKAIYVTGFYPKDDKYYELQVRDIMDSFVLYPPK
jgi:hypothetical protein